MNGPDSPESAARRRVRRWVWGLVLLAIVLHLTRYEHHAVDEDGGMVEIDRWTGRVRHYTLEYEDDAWDRAGVR